MGLVDFFAARYRELGREAIQALTLGIVVVVCVYAALLLGGAWREFLTANGRGRPR